MMQKPGQRVRPRSDRYHTPCLIYLKTAMHQINALIGLGTALVLAGCAGQQPTAAPALNPADARALIEASLPQNVPDRAGWATDMYTALTALTVAPNRANIWAVFAA